MSNSPHELHCRRYGIRGTPHGADHGYSHGAGSHDPLRVPFVDTPDPDDRHACPGAGSDQVQPGCRSAGMCRSRVHGAGDRVVGAGSRRGERFGLSVHRNADRDPMTDERSSGPYRQGPGSQLYGLRPGGQRDVHPTVDHTPSACLLRYPAEVGGELVESASIGVPEAQVQRQVLTARFQKKGRSPNEAFGRRDLVHRDDVQERHSHSND